MCTHTGLLDMLTIRRRTLLLLATVLITGAFARGTENSRLANIANLAAQKHWSEAAQQVQLYRQAYPESIEAAVLQSEIWLHLGLLSDASGILQRVLAIHPRSIEALSASAELSRRLGDRSTAEALLLRCTRYAPRSAEVWQRLGDLYQYLGRKEALAAFQHAHTLAPDDPLAEADVAAAYHQRGEGVQAEYHFRHALHLNEGAAKPNAMVDYLYAEFLQDSNQYQQSLLEYDRSLQRDPAFTDAHLGRAKSLVRLHEWARAESELRGCLKDEERNIAVLNLLTKVAQAEGKNEDAQRYSAQAEQFSNDAVAEKALNNQIASLLQNTHALTLRKQFAEAAESYRQLLDEHPRVSEAWLHLAQCHAELGKLDAAQSDLQHFLSMEPESASGHVLFGRILLRQAQTQAARNEFVHAQQIDPLFADARVGIAASYVMEGNYVEAIHVLRNLADSPGATGESQLMLTEALFKNHQRTEAAQELNRLLKHDPSNKAALQMKVWLSQMGTEH